MSFSWLCVQSYPRPATCQSPFARLRRYLARRDLSCIASEGVTPPSSLLRAHPPDPHPPTSSTPRLVRWVFAGCHQSLLDVGPSRRYFCRSFLGCLAPYPGVSPGAFARFFPEDSGLPPYLTGSALPRLTRTATSVRKGSRGCRHSLMFRPPSLLATQIAPTDTFIVVWPP